MAEYTVEEASRLLRYTQRTILSWCRAHKVVKGKQRYYLTDADLEILDAPAFRDLTSPVRSKHADQQSQDERGATFQGEIQTETAEAREQGLGEGCDGYDTDVQGSPPEST